MSKTNEPNEPMTNMERLKEDASACGPGCACNTGPSGRARWVIGAVVLVVAGALVARAVLKSDSVAAQKPDAEFALSQSAGTAGAALAAVESAASHSATKAAAPPETAADKPGNKPVVCGVLIRSLGDLNQKAMDKDGVFVFLAGQDAAKNREIASVIEQGAATLRGRKINMGVFTLEAGSSEYANLAKQVPPPGVIAMAKGRGATAVRDDITEPKLIQAFVAASSAGGGCGPSGCGPSSADCN